MKEEHSNLTKLRELTYNLPYLENLKNESFISNKVLRMETEIGTLLAFGLLKIEGVSVAQCFLSKGTIMASHQHKENEYIIIYSGSLVITSKSGDVEKIKAPGIYCLSPNTPHKITCLDEDTWCITITIPKSEGFPDAD